ncbi:MAG TPA: SIS domain-containing protein [Anaerolineae bacterium]|nr:SIS domain-containing protein [Anaerolineae bacterium]
MNYMIDQIHSLPTLMHQIFQPLDDTIRSKLGHELCLSLKRLFIIGCGDSHHAALASELVFESLTSIPDEPMMSLQFARYAAGFIPQTGPKTNLVIGVSVSGAVARTVEAVRMGGQAGATTVALTTSPDSPLAKTAQIMLDVPVPQYSSPPGVAVPGVRSHFTSQVALFLIAVRLAEVRGRLNSAEAAGLRMEIQGFGEAVEQTIKVCEPLAKQTAQEWADAREFVFNGSGPNYATALFTAAKVLEASGDPALGQDMEEWAHLQYFAKDASTPTFIITAGERDLSRAEEVAVAAKAIGRRVAVIAPKSLTNLLKNADVHLPFMQVREMFSPLIAAISGELFAAYRAEVIEEPYFRNFSGGRSVEEGGGISRIRTSETWKEWQS